MSELQKCSFCGSRPQQYQDKQVACMNNQCPIYARFMRVEQWNTRPLEDAQAAEIERQKKQILILLDAMPDDYSKLFISHIDIVNNKDAEIERNKEDMAKYLNQAVDMQDEIERLKAKICPNADDDSGFCTRMEGSNKIITKQAAEIKRLKKALELANSMLNYTGCPNCNGGGAIQVSDDEVMQCQWCFEKQSLEQAIKETEK